MLLLYFEHGLQLKKFLYSILHRIKNKIIPCIDYNCVFNCWCILKIHTFEFVPPWATNNEFKTLKGGKHYIYKEKHFYNNFRKTAEASIKR